MFLVLLPLACANKMLQSVSVPRSCGMQCRVASGTAEAKDNRGDSRQYRLQISVTHMHLNEMCKLKPVTSSITGSLPAVAMMRVAGAGAGGATLSEHASARSLTAAHATGPPVLPTTPLAYSFFALLRVQPHDCFCTGIAATTCATRLRQRRRSVCKMW